MKSARALRLLIYLLFSAALAQAAPLLAPAPGQEPGEVKLNADVLTLDVPSDSYRAQGSVRLVQDGVSLLADSVIYRRLSGDALAEGKILLLKDGDSLKGERLSLNLLSQQGELANGELFIKQSNFRVHGKVVEKTGDDNYRIENGSFTTCDGDKPSWRFEASRVDITLDEFATARDAKFYVGDVPLFYTPYLIYPVKRERQSGLMLPKFGHSSKKGLYLDQPYYWVINASQDATFDLDLESRRGVGVGGDFRYLRPRGSEGHLQWYGIYDRQAEKFRGELNQKHLELLSPETTLASDIHLIADRAYYKDYGELSGDYNRQLLESTASFDRRWQRYGLTGEARYTQDLLASNNDATLQRLPALSFTAAGEKIGPVFFSMDSGFVDFQRGQGTVGERLELHPRLSYYAKPAAPLDLSVYGGYRERFYDAHGADANRGLQQIGEADAGGILSLPLERVYDGRLRHLLIPSLEYDFVEQKRQQRIAFFDYDDQVLGQSMAKWSLANVVTEKFASEAGPAEYRDLLYLKLSQGYQISGTRRELLALVDPGHRFTDLKLEGTVNPLKGVSVGFDSRYNPVDGNFSTGNLGVEVKGEGANMAHLGYRYSRGELEYLEGRVVFPIARQFTASVLGRYSIDRGAFLESRYALEYKHQCWSVIAAFSDRPGTPNAPGNISNSGNREFTLNFSLAGLGALGPMRAF